MFVVLHLTRVHLHTDGKSKVKCLKPNGTNFDSKLKNYSTMQLISKIYTGFQVILSTA